MFNANIIRTDVTKETIIGMTYENGYNVLGSYDTIERTLEVLDEISKCYLVNKTTVWNEDETAGEVYNRFIYQMPIEWKHEEGSKIKPLDPIFILLNLIVLRLRYL